MCDSGLLKFWGFLIINNSQTNQLIPSYEKCHFIFLFYLHGVNHEGKVASDTSTFSRVWPVAEIFDHQYLRKELNDTIAFCTEIFLKRR